MSNRLILTTGALKMEGNQDHKTNSTEWPEVRKAGGGGGEREGKGKGGGEKGEGRGRGCLELNAGILVPMDWLCALCGLHV